MAEKIFDANLRLNGPSGPVFATGPGSPNFPAPVGSVYLSTDGDPGAILWVKETGVDTTGWVKIVGVNPTSSFPTALFRTPVTQILPGVPGDYPPASFLLPDETPLIFISPTEIVFGVYYENGGSPFHDIIATEPRGGGGGDVVGPASAVDNAIARFDTTTGKLVQNSGVTLDDNGVMTLPAAPVPAAPAAGKLSLFARSIAGRLLPAVIGPSGIDITLQPSLAANRFVLMTPTSGTTAPGAVGANLTTGGTLSFQQSFTSSNRWLNTARKRATSTTTAGQVCGFRQNYLNFMRGNAAGFGGFLFRAQFGLNINLNGSQCFVGMCPATGALGGNPSTDFPLNMCGMGFDATDPNTGNWFFYRNDGAGGVVRVDLGTDAARTADVGYELNMFIAPNGSELFVYIVNLNTGAVVLDTSYTTDVPSANTGLTWKAEARNGAVAAAVNIEVAKLYIETDY